MQNLIKALIKAKSEFKPIKKDASNPFFKSKYLSLDGLLDAVESALSANGLAIIQSLENANPPALITTIWHTSGESIASAHPLPELGDIQKFGSAITYARRYSIAAILSITADEDDDGNATAANTKSATPAKVAPAAAKNQPPPGWKPSY